MVNTLGRLLKSCSGCASAGNQYFEPGSTSTSKPKLLSSNRSLTRASGRSRPLSSRGVSPIPPPSDETGERGGISDSPGKVKEALKMMGDVIEPDSSNKSTTSKWPQDLEKYCRDNLPQLSQVLEKCGAAANGQATALTGAGKTQNQLSELTELLQDLSHLHWVGAFLCLLGVVLDRCAKASKRTQELQAHMKDLKRLGRHVLEVYGLEQDSGNPVLSEDLQEAVQIISAHADYCFREMGAMCISRFFCAETKHEKLVALEKEIENLYRSLTVTLQLRQSKPNEPPGETFEVSEDTEMVGEGKRVEEALKKLESSDKVEGVSAFILWGMVGTGKSTVGLKVASRLKEERNIDSRQCCVIHMRGNPHIKVTEKQEELYRKLHKRGKDWHFPHVRVGRRELLSLFKSLEEPLLLLFDDVDGDRVHDLETLLPNDLDKSLPSGSILFVTTTNLGVRSVLENKGVHCRDYEVDVLEKKEAQELLLQKILGPADQDGLPDLAVKSHLMHSEAFPKLVDVCGGVPLAVNAVGSSVWNRGQDFLRESLPDKSLRIPSLETGYLKLDSDGKEEFLKKLTTAMNHAYVVLSAGDPINTGSPLSRGLDFAFEQLNSNRPLREVLLDIVAVHLGAKWSDVELECGTENLAKLKQLSMVKCLTYKDGTSGEHEPVVQVHNLLQGMSRKLENLNEEKCHGRRVVVEKDDRPDCFQDGEEPAVYNRVELLKVDHCKDVITAKQLDRLKNLRHLELHGTTIEGKCARVPTHLKHLKCVQSSFPFAPNLQDWRSLVVLEVEGTFDSEVIQSMAKLQKLKVENSCSLKKLGPKLEELTTVIIVNCSNFESIEGLDPATIEHLEIVNCPKFRDFSSVSKLKSLRRLRLAGFESQAPTVFSKFPEELVIPAWVQILDLSRNSNLKELPTFAPNNRIKELNLRFCYGLKQFGGEKVRRLCTLEVLNLGGCEKLERLPSLSKRHSKLKVLDVQGCEKLRGSELRQLLEFMRARNPEFRLIGLRLTDEDGDGPPRGCPALQRYIHFSFKKTQSFVQKVKSELPRGRSLNTCWTFPGAVPDRHRPKYS